MTIQEVDSTAGVLPHSGMTKLILDAMTATRSNVDGLCGDREFIQSVIDAANVLIDALRADRRVLASGNGG
jgi:phosphoheptose isomerase